jgi:hypothetical protein
MKPTIEFLMSRERQSILWPQQVMHFMDEGYLLVSDLIPRDIAAKADDAAWRVNGIDPKDPSTWMNAPKNEFFDEPDLTACYTQDFLIAAAQLASPDPWGFPIARPPANAFVIKLLPEPGPWAVRNIHLDGSGWQPPTHLYPRLWRVFAMVYLHDIEPHGGGTVIFPRSHRKFEALARSQPEKYKFIAQLQDDIEKVDLGQPLEVQPKAGDVLFIDSMSAHCKPMNTGSRPRFALNLKW